MHILEFIGQGTRTYTATSSDCNLQDIASRFTNMFEMHWFVEMLRITLLMKEDGSHLTLNKYLLCQY